MVLLRVEECVCGVCVRLDHRVGCVVDMLLPLGVGATMKLDRHALSGLCHVACV